MKLTLHRILNGLKVAAEFGIITAVIMLALGFGVPTWCTACLIGFLYGYNSKDVI